MSNPRRLFIYSLSILFSIITTTAFAHKNVDLKNQRAESIKRYIKLLGQGDYKAIPQLFAKNAIAVSSSGIEDNPEHFYKTLFTKTISSAHPNQHLNPNSSLIDIFESQINSNMMIGFFNFSWKNIAGKNVSAKFIDLFVFKKGTVKIKAIFVFSNTFKKDIMKQLES